MGLGRGGGVGSRGRGYVVQLLLHRLLPSGNCPLISAVAVLGKNIFVDWPASQFFSYVIIMSLS